MKFHFKPVAIAMSLLALMALPAAAEDVTLRYLSDSGGLDASELADQLGYFKGTGITFKDLGFAQGGPQSLFALAGGSADIGSAATPAVLNAIASGNDFVIAHSWQQQGGKQPWSPFEVLPGSPTERASRTWWWGKKIA